MNREQLLIGALLYCFVILLFSKRTCRDLKARSQTCYSGMHVDAVWSFLPLVQKVSEALALAVS